MLRPGDRFTIPGDERVFEVVRVGPMGAFVRPVTKERVHYVTRGGKEVDYDARRKGLIIATNAIVKLEERGTDGNQRAIRNGRARP